MTYEIDWDRLARAKRYYAANGFAYREVPWLVGSEAVAVTLPEGRKSFDTWAGALVGSGEQSFIHIRRDLKPGKYQTITPCFRDEPKYDRTHLPHFMKCELIRVLGDDDDAEVALSGMLSVATFFYGYPRGDYSVKVAVERVDAGDGVTDLQVAGVEVGSYGVREHDGFRWVFGTGCAEPRASQAFQKYWRRQPLG